MKGRTIIGNNEQVVTLNKSTLPDDIDNTVGVLSDLLHIDITIGDIKLEKNLKDVLYLGQNDLSEQDDTDIDKALNISSEFRISVGVAYAYLQQAFEVAEREFFIFEMQELREAYKRVVQEREEILGKKTQSSLNVTKDERFAELFRLDEIKSNWIILKEQINSLQRDMTILKKVDSALDMRTMFLMGISKRRFAERTGTHL